ncbi:glycosyltransferase family 1 protein [Mucilaginibacter koreensis]
MKNVFLNGRFLTRSLTGVQRTAYELVTALDELIDTGEIDLQQYSFFLIYSGEIINPIQLKHIKLLKKGFFTGNLWEQFELPLYTFGSLLLSMGTISTLFKTKQMVIVHDASFNVNPGYFSSGFRLWYNFAIPLLAKISRHMITVSNFSKKELIEHCGFKAENTSVVYNAANHIRRFNEPGSDFIEKIEQLKPYCLAVSSLGANKNFEGLSRALNQIDFRKYQMVIAGGVIGALKQSSRSKAINYLGYVSDAELKYLYGNASLFVFPSFYEGFGIPPLEAMLMGCPVAASHTSSIPEVLEDACAYFNPADDSSIAAAIDELINNEGKLAELKNKGLAQAAKYNWHKSARQVYQLIKQYSD